MWHYDDACQLCNWFRGEFEGIVPVRCSQVAQWHWQESSDNENICCNIPRHNTVSVTTYNHLLTIGPSWQALCLQSLLSPSFVWPIIRCFVLFQASYCIGWIKVPTATKTELIECILRSWIRTWFLNVERLIAFRLIRLLLLLRCSLECDNIPIRTRCYIIGYQDDRCWSCLDLHRISRHLQVRNLLTNWNISFEGTAPDILFNMVLKQEKVLKNSYSILFLSKIKVFTKWQPINVLCAIVHVSWKWWRHEASLHKSIYWKYKSSRCRYCYSVTQYISLLWLWQQSLWISRFKIAKDDLTSLQSALFNVERAHPEASLPHALPDLYFCPKLLKCLIVIWTIVLVIKCMLYYLHFSVTMILLLWLMIHGSLSSRYYLADLGQSGPGVSDHKVKELPMVKPVKEKLVSSNIQE